MSEFSSDTIWKWYNLEVMQFGSGAICNLEVVQFGSGTLWKLYNLEVTNWKCARPQWASVRMGVCCACGVVSSQTLHKMYAHA